MNRKQLEDCAWAKTPKDERRSQKERYDWRTQKTITERLKGNEREVRVFDPSGSTEGTLSPWFPLWGLYSDELEQRCKEEREPKLRPPYSRMRSDYTGDVESSPVGRRHSTVKSPRHSAPKTPSQLQREIDEALRGGLNVGDVVQLRWEPGTGGVIRRFDADDAWVATPRGDRKVPADALVRVRKEHEARVRRAAGAQRGHSTIKASTAFDEARAESALIEKEVNAASDALRAFPRGSMGLTPDAVRATLEYRAANARYQKAFARQRAFNTTFTKKFAKELRAERDKRYGR